jgi:hypothetical protein
MLLLRRGICGRRLQVQQVIGHRDVVRRLSLSRCSGSRPFRNFLV